MSRLLASLLFTVVAVAAEPGGTPPDAAPGQRWEPIATLSDEFNGTALDAARWMPKHAYWTGREPSRFEPANVAVADGMLRLKSTTERTSLVGIADPKKDVWVSAACISSQGRLAGPGFYAARVKASRLAMTSSFWLQGKYSEIDVVEQFGAPTQPERAMLMLMNTHYFANGWKNDQITPREWKMPTGSADGFHVYAVWWRDPTTLWFYHDGVKVAEMTPAARFEEPMYLFFDTETFPWQGLPDIASLRDPVRNTMEVDWVRSWRLVPTTVPATTP